MVRRRRSVAVPWGSPPTLPCPPCLPHQQQCLSPASHTAASMVHGSEGKEAMPARGPADAAPPLLCRHNGHACRAAHHRRYWEYLSCPGELEACESYTMLRAVRDAARLRLREGRDFPLELLVCPLLVLLFASRYPRYAEERGCWLCSRCGGRIESGKHMALHTCRESNRPVRCIQVLPPPPPPPAPTCRCRPGAAGALRYFLCKLLFICCTPPLQRWLKAEMEQHGALDDRSRCKLCAKPVGERPHVCSSPLACSFVADFSALYEPWHGLGQEKFAGLRRLQGQVVVVMPEKAHFEQPAQALQTGEFMLFQVLSCLLQVLSWGCSRPYVAATAGSPAAAAAGCSSRAAPGSGSGRVQQQGSPGQRQWCLLC